MVYFCFSFLRVKESPWLLLGILELALHYFYKLGWWGLKWVYEAGGGGGERGRKVKMLYLHLHPYLHLHLCLRLRLNAM
jgi:hypothetical protein